MIQNISQNQEDMPKKVLEICRIPPISCIHLKKHLENSAKDATYISKESQNDFIKHAGEAISDKIIEEVKKSGLYSIIADEARDCSNKEQMSLVLRYVDSNLDV